eukprot:s1028_g3.t1
MSKGSSEEQLIRQSHTAHKRMGQFGATVTKFQKEGRPLSELPAPKATPEQLDPRVACPFCGRKFGEEQAKRHMPFCEQQAKKNRASKPPKAGGAARPAAKPPRKKPIAALNRSQLFQLCDLRNFCILNMGADLSQAKPESVEVGKFACELILEEMWKEIRTKADKKEDEKKKVPTAGGRRIPSPLQDMIEETTTEPKMEQSPEADDAAFANELDFSYEERADLLADLLEEDTSLFPLLDCPPEVLSSVLLLSEAVTSVRLRPLCRQMRVAVDSNEGLWSLLTLRDFADLGGTTKHYKGLRTLAEWDESNAMRRLEWDPLMICAPPALRYSLLAAMQVRRQLWSKHGPSLGAGWDWFSAKVCRRMAVPTFLRWASLQHEPSSLQALLQPLGLSTDSRKRSLGAALSAPGATAADSAEPEAKRSRGAGMRFRCGRSDAVELSEEAVNDIYETVQRWHSKEHREMMRAHFQRGDDDKKKTSELPRSNSGAFSVTPTLDAHEAAVFALNDYESSKDETPKVSAAKAAAREARGAASRHIEEAQLRLAMELSKREAEPAAPGRDGDSTGATAAPGPTDASGPPSEAPKEPEEPATEKVQAGGDLPILETPKVTPEFTGLPLRGEGGVPAAQVFVKPHCLATRVETLPDALERSIESIVHKLVTPSSWALLYESVTEELCLRAKCAAHALCASHAKAMDQLDDLATGDTAKLQGADQISLDHERMCLPIWRKSFVMSGLSCLGGTNGGDAVELRLNNARHEFLKHAMLEWCELEDLTEFLDAQLGPLETW